MTTTPANLHPALPVPSTRPTAGAQAQPQRARPQVRRYTTTTLLPNGNICETRHLAPAMPLFEDAFCAFARGSLIDTDMGPVAIEDLMPGDRVVTVDGDLQPVVWKGNVTIVPGLKQNQKREMKLTRLMADSFGLSRPMRSVIAGPSARLLHTPLKMRALAGQTQILAPVSAFVDGVNVIETAPPTAVELFHFCLPRHAAVRVGGLEFESYHPGTNATRMISHAMRSLFLNLFSHIDSVGEFGPLAYSRAGEGQVDAIGA